MWGLWVLQHELCWLKEFLVESGWAGQTQKQANQDTPAGNPFLPSLATKDDLPTIVVMAFVLPQGRNPKERKW